MRIDWSATAVADLQSLRDYIAQDSPYFARRFTERIIAAVAKLKDFPKIGRNVPEARRNGVRELIFQGYRIVYLIEPERILILTIVHGSRDLMRRARKPWEVD
ncbi:MAG: type II toxin-antitoxin system RelE/ParE family toxin [Kiloniellales bacterium]